MDASTPADKFDFETSTVVMKTPGDAIHREKNNQLMQEALGI